MDKPLILAMDEAEKELVGTINQIIKKHSLPCYLFEMIVDKVHRELKGMASNELVTASTHYVAQGEERKEGEET